MMREGEEVAVAEGKLLARLADGVAAIVFNQPEKRNAMSAAMWHGLAALLDDFANDGRVRVVVLTGAGGRAFVSGADLGEFGAKHDSGAQRDDTTAAREAVGAFPKPVIASIRGYCLGGGLAIAAQADLRIAAADAVFGVPAAQLGIAYDPRMIEQLAAVVGAARTRMLLFTGERIDAAEAERIGLVHQTVAAPALDEAVSNLARRIAANAPLALRAMKRGIAEAQKPAVQRDDAGLALAIDACFASADCREGRAAFAERRPPRFLGC